MLSCRRFGSTVSFPVSQLASHSASQLQTEFNSYSVSNCGVAAGESQNPKVGLVEGQQHQQQETGSNATLQISTFPFGSHTAASHLASQQASQFTMQGASAHWDNINQAYGHVRQAGSWKVPDRVGPPFVVGGVTRDRGATSNIRPHTSTAFSSQPCNNTTFPGKPIDLAGRAGTNFMGEPPPNHVKPACGRRTPHRSPITNLNLRNGRATRIGKPTIARQPESIFLSLLP